MLIDHSFIQYAFNQKKERVSIFDVPNGKNCSYFCRICGDPLGARNKGKTRTTVLKPNQKVPHFYHLSTSNCKGETLIHILAKEIFLESIKLMLTIQEVDQQGFFSKYIYQMVYFDDVILEEKLKWGNTYIQPDAIGKVKGKSLYVEFAYSHCVDYKKNELLQKYKKDA